MLKIVRVRVQVCYWPSVECRICGLCVGLLVCWFVGLLVCVCVRLCECASV